MRGRWLKPEFMRDKKIAQLGLAAALIYQTLWCIADDGGVARGAAEEIKGEMLVWWEELDVPAIRASLAKLEAAGRISGFALGDHQYWTLHNLLKHQGKIHKASKFRHPRPEDSGTTPAPLPENDGTAPYFSTSVPQHLDTSTPVESDTGGLCRLLITRLNQGMQDNPEIANQLNPIPHGHGPSFMAAGEIANAGVESGFAASAVYGAAKKFKPAGRNRQIRSLGYLTAGVIEAWEKSGALAAASNTSRPALPQLPPKTPGYASDRASRSIQNINAWLRDKETTDAEVIPNGE